MDKIPEACALLGKTSLSHRSGYQEIDDNSSCDEWTDTSSSSSYSDSNSSIAEWENLIEESGELLYIDCHPHIKESIPEKTEEVLTRTSTRRSTRGKFSRLIRRRESKRYSKRSITSFTDAYAISENKVTFHDCQEGEVRNVTIKIDPRSRHKLGRRATLVESLFGLNISTFSDGNRVMIAGFVPDGEAIKHRNIKIGDWLKCVNDTDVNINTINNVLESMTETQDVHLKLQRIAGVEVTSEPPMNELSNQSEFVKQLTNPNVIDLELYTDILCNFPIGVLCLKTDELSESGPEFEGVVYCYPAPMNRNCLCTSRGTFITINHLIPEVFKTKSISSTVSINSILTHIIYNSFGNILLLLCFPDMRCSLQESLCLNAEIIRVLQFCYQSIERCFMMDKFKVHLNRFFLRFYTKLLTGVMQSIDLEKLSNLTLNEHATEFESVLPAVQLISLPREAQMQLEDALNELEASDYRDWNEDPLDCQRLFTIIGSSFYHSGYLLANHLPWEDHIDVHAFCRQNGIFHLSQTEPIRTLILWREVFPSSCNRGMPDDSRFYKLPEGRWFLLVVGNSQDILTVLMETGGCTVPAEENQGPDPFYVEEAQATLAHIQNMGITALADKWISLNLRPQVVSPDLSPHKNQKRMDFLGNIGFMKSHSPPAKPPSPASKKPEVTSILKHRNSMYKSNPTLSGSSSLFSNDDVSEDSTSQGAHSEISDEPILGRRAAREKLMDSDDSDSDWEAYRPESQISGTFDISDLKQLSDMIPSKLTAGEENVLFHYVQFDSAEGILVCPPERDNCAQLTKKVLHNFRKCAQNIHSLFQNTIRFKSMLTQDIAKSTVNKSLIAIKEYGVLFECSTEENGKKLNTLTYWVIGRLFYNPHPRELYICYQDSIPQNLIEIAFRLGTHMAG